MPQREKDLLIWGFIVVALFLLLYWTEQSERVKVAGRILALTGFSYKTRDTHNKLKR